MQIKVCSIDGCGKPVHGWGWCGAHYERWRVHGDPLGGRTPPGEPMRFFLDTVVSYAGDECLHWPYSRNQSGYGDVRFNGGHHKVHRLACEALNGPPPTPKHEAAHSCGNGHLGCVNPKHLRWATPAENHGDKIAHGTTNRGEKSPMAKLTELDVISIRNRHGDTPSSLALEYGVAPRTIRDAMSGKTWGWLRTPSTHCLGDTLAAAE